MLRRDLPISFYKQLLRDIRGATIGADTGELVEHYTQLYEEFSKEIEEAEKPK